MARQVNRKLVSASADSVKIETQLSIEHQHRVAQQTEGTFKIMFCFMRRCLAAEEKEESKKQVPEEPQDF